MNILTLIQGLYGQRIVDNLNLRGPDNWQISVVPIPRALPFIVDKPEEFLPEDLPSADLVLHLTETSQAAQLLPGVVMLSGAHAVIAPIDNGAWIPAGLRRQLRAELAAIGAAIVFPQPFCSLTETVIDPEGDLQRVQHLLLMSFTHYFGRPSLRISLNGADKRSIAEVVVKRGAPCGSSHFAAEQLCGMKVDEAVPKGGLICLHYPCLASMQPTAPEKGVENLMHLSGCIFNDELEYALSRAVYRAE